MPERSLTLVIYRRSEVLPRQFAHGILAEALAEGAEDQEEVGSNEYILAGPTWPEGGEDQVATLPWSCPD